MEARGNYCTIYLVRHGETEFNAKGIMQGHIDIPLSEVGREQIRILSQEFRDIKFDAIFSSDLLRTKETAEILKAERKLAVQTSQLIRERNYGDHEGRLGSEYNKLLKEAQEQIKTLAELAGKTTFDILGVENNESLTTRALTFLREVSAAHPGKTILIAAHGSLMRTFLRHVDPTFVGKKFVNGGYIKMRCDGTDFFVDEIHGIAPMLPE